MSTLMLATAVFLIAFDFQNLLSLWWGKVLLPDGTESHDFTLVVPLFGDPKYFERRDELLVFQEQVLVAIEVSPEKMARFADQLEGEGWRVERIVQESPNPASLMKAGLDAVTTTYVLRLDADTFVDVRLPLTVAAVAASGADICSTKVEARNPRTIPAKLQALEYRMAMLSRHFRPWMTSGACFIGKTDSMRRIYAQHSLWSPGEDIETGRIAHALKMKIRHADMVVQTDVPETWRALFRQRTLWWAGSFRHTIVNADRNLLQLPVQTTYLIFVVWASVYYRWWSHIDVHSLPKTLPLLFLVYIVVTFISNIQVASPWMLVFPLYALVHTMVLPAIGALRFVILARKRGRLGRYEFGYRRSSTQANPRATPDPLVTWASGLREAA